MKIFIYSDLHISKTSSILPSSSGNNIYSFRQDMIIKTGEFMKNIIQQQKPDVIINLGDTFDQHTITSYDVRTASEFFNCFSEFKDIPHYVLVGNHEMINSNYNAIALLDNIPNITVIDEPKSIGEIAFLPYCDFKTILSYPEGTFLFSHNDIQGSVIRNGFTMPDGISLDNLSKYKIVFNGHIHKPSMMKNVVNVGSVSTHSFSDDSECVPQCYIFDTVSLDLQTFRPNTCPLFRKFEIESDINELHTFLNALDTNYRYILHCVCSFEMKEEVKKILEDSQLILNSRLNVRIKKSDNMIEETSEEQDTVLSSNIDMKQSFKEFLNTTELKFPLDMYLQILNELN